MDEDFEKIAVIGMSGAFPGARNIGEFWKLLCEKREGISTLSREELLASGENPSLLDDPQYVPRGGFLEDGETFDHEFFAVSAKDALTMDPQQRLFLTHAQLALEDAGLVPQKITSPVGVFAAAGPSQYWFLLRDGEYSKSLEDFHGMLGNDKDFIATRVSYKLNLNGPSMTVQSACSSGLTSIGMACQSLLTWNCDMALAGAAVMTAPRRRGYVAYEGMITSPTGRCSPFDEQADGTLFGEGVGVVCLKRLSDALEDKDHIYAVIDAVAINNDGSDKVGFTAPSVTGQAKVIETAHILADVTPEQIGYVEAHGTGTSLGDPIEIQGLTQAFRKNTQKTGFCHLGSVKSNIGHLDAAAGLASFIKTVLVVHNGLIPPMANFTRPNPNLDLINTPFLINKEPVNWGLNGGRRIAGVSAFGIGGTNVHVILESPPVVPDQGESPEGNTLPPCLLLSAKNPQVLREYAVSVANFLDNNPGIPEGALIAKIMKLRPDYPYRKAFLAVDRDSLLQELKTPLEEPTPAVPCPVVFSFPGQGAQFAGMAKGYYGVLPAFTSWVDRGTSLAAQQGCPGLKDILLDPNSEADLSRTDLAQPLLFIIEYALAKELLSLGIKPDLLLGHSLGEYVGAAMGGVMDYEDALKLVIRRGLLMERSPEGGMVAVALSAGDAKKYLGPDTMLSVINGPQQSVISGTPKAIQDLETKLLAAGIKHSRLKARHGFHSSLMNPILGDFEDELAKTTFRPPTISMIRNLDGKLADPATDWKSYWLSQLNHTVRFEDCLQSLKGFGPVQIIEVGPGTTLSAFFKQSFPEQENVNAILPNRHSSEVFFQKAILRLWERGVKVNFTLPAPVKSPLILFPGYPFQKKRFWPAPKAVNPPRIPVPQPLPSALSDPDPQPSETLELSLESRQRIRRVWTEVLGHEDFDDRTSFFLCGGDSFAGIQLLRSLKTNMGLSLTMQELMENPTVEGLFALLGTSPKLPGKKSRYLFPVQPHGDMPPLFMVAGAHENRYFDPVTMKNSYEEDFYRYFSVLISALGPNQPIYGFRPKGVVMSEPQHRSVTLMAEAYIKAMKEVQPQGPYHLGGECVGGIVALEMAALLEARGEKVRRLFLMDTPRPTLWVALREDLLARRGQVRGFIFDVKTALKTKNWGHFLRTQLTALSLSLTSHFPVTERMRQLRRGLLGSEFYRRTLLLHKPKSFTGPVSYIVNRRWNARKYLMGWKHELGGQLRVYVVPGSHGNRITVSGKQIGSIIRKEMEQD